MTTLIEKQQKNVIKLFYYFCTLVFVLIIFLNESQTTFLNFTTEMTVMLNRKYEFHALIDKINRYIQIHLITEKKSQISPSYSPLQNDYFLI